MNHSEVEMQVKSNHSYDAGVELISKKFYTESIHCLYYSVIQMMMYRLATSTYRPLSYEEQKVKRNMFSSSTHEWLYDEIKNRITLQGQRKRSFCEDFRFLKRERVEADYEKRWFGVEDSVECREISERLRANLRYIK